MSRPPVPSLFEGSVYTNSLLLYVFPSNDQKQRRIIEKNIYKPRFKSTYDRLLKEAREEKYRQLSINFDTDIATHVPEFESDGITVLSIKGKYSPIMQRYLIFDGKSIVYLRCDEDLSAQQMDVIRRSFL